MNRNLFLLIFLFKAIICFSQFGNRSEIGVVFGPVSFRSDYGYREDNQIMTGSPGFGFGIVHYMNFTDYSGYNAYSKDLYFYEHFKFRNELSFHKSELNHYGKWVDPSKTSEGAEKLRAHSGEINNLEIGTSLEYHPVSVRDFENAYFNFSPYISLGAHAIYSSPVVQTAYGDNDINNPDNFFPTWNPEAISNESEWSLCFTGSVGTRYKLAQYSDVVIDMRWQYFNKDTIDGLDHDLPSNKYNDWMVWLNFGYVYYIN